MNARLKAFFYFLGIIAVLFFSFLMLQITLPYLSFKPDVDFLRTKRRIIHIDIWRWSFYTHVMSSLFVLVLGVFQFLPGLIKRYKPVHRWVGRIYVYDILFITGPSAMVMAFYANAGFPAQLSFVILAGLWWGTTALALWFAVKGKLTLHSDFVIRSYALTLSAVTLRIYAYLLPHFVHMKAKDEYILIAWLSWVPNLLIAELIIQLGKKGRHSVAVQA